MAINNIHDTDGHRHAAPGSAMGPDLYVFDGFGSRIEPRLNKCPVSIGKNFRLDETLKLAVKLKNAVGMLGTL